MAPARCHRPMSIFEIHDALLRHPSVVDAATVVMVRPASLPVAA